MEASPITALTGALSAREFIYGAGDLASQEEELDDIHGPSDHDIYYASSSRQIMLCAIKVTVVSGRY